MDIAVHIKKACEHVGTLSDLAKLLDVTPQYIYALIRGVKKPSPKLSKKIEEITNGLVSKHDLRPDIWTKNE